MNAVLSALDTRAMDSADIPEVMAVEQRIYPFPWTVGNFADSLHAGYSAWVCRDQGALAGYAVMMLALDEAQLLNIGIAPAWQRRGCGSVLMEYLFDVAKRAGAVRMFLEVRPSNGPALALYGRLGFVRIGLRRGYYPAASGREDAVVMARDL